MKKEDLIWPLIALTTILGFFVFHVDHRKIEQAYTPTPKVRFKKFNKNEFEASYRIKENLKLEEQLNWREFNHRVIVKDISCLKEVIPSLSNEQDTLNGRDLLLTAKDQPVLQEISFENIEDSISYVYLFKLDDGLVKYKKFKLSNMTLARKADLGQHQYDELLSKIKNIVHTKKVYHWEDESSHKIITTFYDGRPVHVQVEGSPIVCSSPQFFNKNKDSPVKLSCRCEL